jgi:hypothetical protein
MFLKKGSAEDFDQGNILLLIRTGHLEHLATITNRGRSLGGGSCCRAPGPRIGPFAATGG